MTDTDKRQWELLPDTFSPRIYVVRVDRTDDEPAIASVIHRDSAKLIAAAPELRDALQLVVGSLKFDREDLVSVEVMRRVNAAIKAAS